MGTAGCFEVCIIAQNLDSLNFLSREKYTPDIDTNNWPPCVAVKSVHNIVAESTWKWWLKEYGFDLRNIILEGQSNGLFNPNSPLHVYVHPHLTAIDP